VRVGPVLCSHRATEGHLSRPPHDSIDVAVFAFLRDLVTTTRSSACCLSIRFQSSQPLVSFQSVKAVLRLTTESVEAEFRREYGLILAQLCQLPRQVGVPTNEVQEQ